jgi:transcriptional regulator with XRE-family HTH domain
MNIAGSSLQTPVGYGSTSSIREQLFDSLRASKEYRHSFLEESISARITAQIRALRDAHNYDYKAFADLINKKPSWTYRLEDPNAPPPTIPTLLQIAEAFDVALDVRFCAFSQLVSDMSSLNPKSFVVRSFDEEVRAGSFSKKRRHRRDVRSSRIVLPKAHGGTLSNCSHKIDGLSATQVLAAA